MKKIVLNIFALLTIVFVPVNAKSLQQLLAPEDAFRHGYTELSASEKRVYDYMFSQFVNFEANSDIYSDVMYNRVYFDFASQGIATPTATTINNMLKLLYNDIPELYMMYTPIYRYDNERGMYYGRISKYTYTPDKYLSQLQQCDEAFEYISRNITDAMSDYEKALILHDEFIAWSNYGGMESGYSGNIVGAFIDKRAVCEGFTRAYQYLCQRVGLKCIFVEGKYLRGSDPADDSSWENHAWNLIEINGEWYQVDITVDGGFPGVCGHLGFLVGNDYYTQNYKADVTKSGYKSLPILNTSNFEPQETNIPSETKSSSATIKEVYDLTGHRTNGFVKGINIVVFTDGTVRKIIK